ncbi:MAG: tetratricopeptide repeat protein [Hyphomicrobiaceae bacterium]
MVQQRDQLAREVDEELRREQLLKVWEQYGTYIIAVGLLIIVGVGGVKYYQHRTAVAAEAAGGRFITAARQLSDSQSDARKELEGIVADGPTGYATLARLRLAAANAAAGKTIEAANEFDSIAQIRGVDALLRDYARLQSAMLRVDVANWTDMQNRLNDLAAEGNSWRFSARELLGLSAYKAGRTQEARQEFERLASDREVPQSIAERARIMMGIIAQAELAKSMPQVPDKPAEAPAKSDDKSKSDGTKADAKKSK